MARGYVKVWFILTDRCSSTSRHIPVSRYAREFILPVSIPIIICLTVYWCEILTYFDLKTSPMWYNHLLMRNLIFICMSAQEQVREQVSTFVQQRDELDSRINVIFYHLFDLDMWLFITYWGRMQYVICTRMYSIMEDLDLRPRYFSVKDTTMIPRW